MITRIDTEKMWVHDRKCRKIIDISGALLKGDLPGKYTSEGARYFLLAFNQTARVWAGDCYITIDRGCDCPLWFWDGDKEENVIGKYNNAILPGCILLEEDFQKIVNILKAGGERLSEIRRQEKARWKGYETISI